jgi:hypothetical protein
MLEPEHTVPLLAAEAVTDGNAFTTTFPLALALQVAEVPTE